LIEIMVTVALLSFIVVGLLSMFNQTQRAFRNSMTQTDVLESGRLVMDMLSREMQQAKPLGARNSTNFMCYVSPAFRDPTVFPLLQGMPGTVNPNDATKQDYRTNIVQSIFFLSQTNQDWLATGYFVLQDAGPHVGTLYRFFQRFSRYDAWNAASNFLAAADYAARTSLSGLPVTNVNRLADGVIHFRVEPFATNGFPLTARFGTNAWFAYPSGTGFGQMIVRNSKAVNWLADQNDFYFTSNAVPASLDLELGILEPTVMERYRGIGLGNAVAQLNYLSNHVGQVHVFRQQVPVRGFDYTAYQ
jgi:hypothetical protein